MKLWYVPTFLYWAKKWAGTGSRGSHTRSLKANENVNLPFAALVDEMSNWNRDVFVSWCAHATVKEASSNKKLSL